MAEIEKLLGEAVNELDRLLQARNVAGEPIVHGDVTLIPLVSYGFGFGAGGGTDPKTSGEGGGTGGGGGIKPVAVVVIDDKGAHIEPIKGPRASMADALGTLAGKIAEGNRKGRENTSPGRRGD
jgi:uncharacterized spore protein YtfJ